MKYQKRFPRGAFSSGVQCAGFTLGRGDGKTGLASTLGLLAPRPDSPLHYPGFEAVVIASSFNQACICDCSVKASLELMGAEKECRVRDSQTLFEIEHKTSKARLRVYGSDSKRVYGLRPNLVLCDEPAQGEIDGERLAATLQTALGKRQGAKLLAMGII